LKTHPELCLVDVSQLFLSKEAGGLACDLEQLAMCHALLCSHGYGNDRVKHFLKALTAFGTWGLCQHEDFANHETAREVIHSIFSVLLI